MTLPKDLQDALLEIRHIPRNSLNSDQIRIYKAVYHNVTRKVPATGCSQLCTTVYLLVRNVIKKLEAIHPVAEPNRKAKVEVKRVAEPRDENGKPYGDMYKMTAKELKEIAKERGIKYARNATKTKMLELLQSNEK